MVGDLIDHSLHFLEDNNAPDSLVLEIILVFSHKGSLLYFWQFTFCKLP